MSKWCQEFWNRRKQLRRLILNSDCGTSHIVPTWQDLDVLQTIDSAISSLSSLTGIPSGERYVTVSAVLLMLHILDTDLLKGDITDIELTKDIKHHVVEDIKGRYSKLDDTVNQFCK